MSRSEPQDPEIDAIAMAPGMRVTLACTGILSWQLKGEL